MTRRRVPLVLFVLSVMAATTGCPATGFFGRYIVLNSGKTAVQNIAISAAGQEKTWAVTPPGQGWIVDNFGPNSMVVDLVWVNDAGEQKQTTIDFSSHAKGHCTDDLIIEFAAGGIPHWHLARRN